MWRMFLESLCHEQSSFLTLTYASDHLPKDGSLDPKHVKDWLKRFRHSIAPVKVRYFLCGEYGSETGRPHYHASLFGIGQECSELVRSTWGMGHIMLAEFNEKTAQYVAGYVVKKLTHKDDPWLNGRYPEFARMSLRPGIGAPAMKVIADAIHTNAGLDALYNSGDVPTFLQLGKRKIPLGRYLLSQLRKEVGMPQEWIDRAKQKVTTEIVSEMLVLLSDALENSETATFKKAVVQDNLQKVRNLESRSLVWKKKGTL